MAKLGILVCLALLGVCALASPQSLGGANPLSRSEMDELFPRIFAALDKWAETHNDFNVKLTSIKSGSCQIVAGRICNLNVEDSESTEWMARTEEKLDGSFKEINLTIPGKKMHLLTWD